MVDVSLAGFRILHDGKLAPGTLHRLEFDWNEELYAFRVKVVRSQIGGRSGEKLIYHSGLLLVEGIGPSKENLQERLQQLDESAVCPDERDPKKRRSAPPPPPPPEAPELSEPEIESDLATESGAFAPPELEISFESEPEISSVTEESVEIESDLAADSGAFATSPEIEISFESEPEIPLEIDAEPAGNDSGTHPEEIEEKLEVQAEEPDAVQPEESATPEEAPDLSLELETPAPETTPPSSQPPPARSRFDELPTDDEVETDTSLELELDMALEAAAPTSPPPRKPFIECRFSADGEWTTRPVDTPTQPEDGFTVEDPDDPEEVELLCRSYAMADPETRGFMRVAFAQKTSGS